jgi:RNA ligase (TIGR02306 family)
MQQNLYWKLKMTDITRKLATIRRIDKIEPIEGADKIVKATVGGWQLVTAITNGFKEGDLVIYLEIDSWVPTAVAPFLTKPGHTPKVYNGVEGEKLRTIRLRGQVSQGLLLPIPADWSCDMIDGAAQELGYTIIGGTVIYMEDADVTELLGIQKYEKPLSAELAGTARGNFPSRIPKTDQERIQNLAKEMNTKFRNVEWEVTEKLEGSSMTVYVLDGVFGVCSRNLDLVRNEENTFWKTAIDEKLEEKLLGLGIDIAIQGELIGPGIQDNIYMLSEYQFRVFDVIDIPTRSYYAPAQRRNLIKELCLQHAPVIHTNWLLDAETMQDIIKMADGESVVCDKHVAREGIVFKSIAGTMSFKSISQKYLLNSVD